uniref:NADH dehydrogenase subunit 6 n=1 Tax=Panagrolaimus superbus TaxID=310955 RepID=A0A914YAV9_9BILA
MVARAFPEKASFIHPILCFIATLSLIIGCIIFGINKKEGWVWSDSPSTSNGVVIFKQGYNDVNLFPPRDFEYYNSIGVYIAVVAILLSIVSIVLSAAAAVMIGRGMKMNIGASSAPPPSSTSSGTRSS